MGEFKYSVSTDSESNDRERSVFINGLDTLDDWEDLKLLIEPCVQKIYDNCNGSTNNTFKMVTWELQQYIAKQILVIHPPCIHLENPDLIVEQIRIKTVRAIEDATRRVEIKDFFRCDRYIREQEKKRNDIK